MKIELEETFKACLSDGFNLFTGAGFSILAKDRNNIALPLGNQLRDELADRFSLPKSLSLPQLSTVIESISPALFMEFLKKRFNIDTYDERYNILKELNISSLYTTNIDNLILKIYENDINHYLNDITCVGPSYNDRNAINYAPLHGSITDSSRKMIFNTVDLSITFNNEQAVWMSLRNTISKCPTLFVGYGLSDASVIQALYSKESQNKPHSTKWILLYEHDVASIAYFKALGFSIIEGSIEDCLNYFNNITSVVKAQEVEILNDPKVVFPSESIPTNTADLPIRSLKHFFLGAEPIWSDIYNNIIPQTKYYNELVNSILSNKNVIMLGVPASGKTTLLMQVAAQMKFKGIKLICSNVTYEKAELIVARLQDDKALIFMDDFADNIKTFNYFHSCKNISLVGFDRHYNYEIISHRINHSSFIINDITPMSKQDINLLFSRIPKEIRKEGIIDKLRENIDPSLFEFVSLNTTLPQISTRYKEVIYDLENEDPLLCDLLVMLCYVSSCRSIASFDMTLAFLGNEIYDYREVYENLDKLTEIIVEFDDSVVGQDQDYFVPRSSLISRAILDQVPQKIFQRVLRQFHSNVSRWTIHRFDRFKKYGYDSDFARKAFPNERDGKEFYENILATNRSPFILQQGALYLSSKKQFRDAFKWIDEALIVSKNKYFSIRNTYAIILFRANINTGGDAENIRKSLDESMQLLEKCYSADKRKIYHTITYARQTLEYYSRFGENDNSSIRYLKKSKDWLKEERRNNYWNRDVKTLLRDVELIA